MSAHRVTHLVTRALEVEDQTGCSPVAALDIAHQETTRRYGSVAPCTLESARRVLGAARRRLHRELTADIARVTDASENMSRQIQGGRPGHA